MTKSRLTLLASLIAATCALATAPNAAAGPPGTWTQATGPHTNTAEVGTARTPDGTLHVLWPSDAGLAGSANHSSIAPDAKSIGGPHAIFTYPGGINSRMDLIAEGAGIRAFFSGLFTSGSEPLQGLMATATSADGVAWSVQPTPASNDTPSGKSKVYAASGISAAATPSGPFTAWGDSGFDEAGYHAGILASNPDERYSTGCCAYAPGIGVDAQTGQTVLAWQFLQSTKGVAYQSISPAGPRTEPPGPSTGSTSTRTAISGRIGAPGVYLAYLFGTNQFTSIPAIVRTGSTKVLKFTRDRGAQHLGIARAPGGRMWLFWVRSNKITAVRSNPAVTRFGAPVTLKPPAGTTTVYNLAGEGSPGQLDLLALSETGAGIFNWHQRVRPGLTLKYKSGKGKIKFTVTDAGTPVKGAKVKAGGKSKKTNSKGRVTIKLKKGKYKSKATKTGYAPASVKAKSK